MSRTRREWDPAIAALAAKQQGNVARWQLLALGMNDAAIGHRVASRRLYPVRRGVYAVGRRAVTALEHASGAVLACGPEAALGHGSAMTLWGYWRYWEAPFHVIAPRQLRPTGITTHRTQTHDRRDFTRQHGIRVTKPARTVLDVASSLDDRQLKRVVNTALHSPWLTESHLLELLERRPHLPGATRIASLVGGAGNPERSGWEDDFPAFCARFGLPQPVMGAIVLGHEVDALFVEERVIVELDGWQFHQGKIAFEDDRERDAHMLAGGFVTVRLTWRLSHEHAHREAARLRTILAQRARNRGVPGQ
jgi:hypothetical protein